MTELLRASLLLGLVTVCGGSRSAVHQQPLQTQLQPWLSHTMPARDGPTLSAHRRLEVLRGGAAPVGAPAAQLDEPPLRAPRRTKPAQQLPAAKAAKSEPLAAAPVPPHVTKKLQHVLVVEAGEADQDGSTALLHPKKLAQLGLMEGDIVRLKGKRDRDTLCTALGRDAHQPQPPPRRDDQGIPM